MITVKIDKDLVRHFELILTKEALDRLEQGAVDTFGIGAVEDGMPVGAVVVQCKPPVGEIISLYIVEEYRMRGIGSSLCFEALQALMLNQGLQSMIATYMERTDEDIYGSFFQSMFFDVDQIGEDYTFSVKDATEVLKERKWDQLSTPIRSYGQLLKRHKNLLFMEETNLAEYINAGCLREELTFVEVDEEENRIRGCIVFAEDQGELVLAWMRAVNDPKLMVRLISSAILSLSQTEPADRIVHCPTINTASKNLLERLLGDRAHHDGVSYQAIFDFA